MGPAGCDFCRAAMFGPAENCFATAAGWLSKSLSPTCEASRMKEAIDRRSFLRVAGTSLRVEALSGVFTALARGENHALIALTLAELNGEAPAPFSFTELSDKQVGFNRPPDPLGTKRSKRWSPPSTDSRIVPSWRSSRAI